MVDAFSLWAPGLKTKEDWLAWTNGLKEIDDSPEAPKLDFAPPIATRRFSQLTKMTCWMAHRLALDTDILFFTSARGEINIQYKINTDFARDDELKPALFTLSVFNTAPAEATILLGSKVPYSPLFSGFTDTIKNLVRAGSAPLKSGRLKSAMLIYAEERVPDEYRANITGGWFPPLCIGVKISGKDSGADFPREALESPKAFAKHLVEHNGNAWVG